MLPHQILHRAFNFAVKWGWLCFNPCDRVMRPGYRKRERQLWTVEQCRLFLDGAKNSEWYPLFITAMFTGCRFSELAALRWSDLDVNDKTLVVERTLQKVKVKGRWLETSPKTTAGRRIISVEDFALEALRVQKQTQTLWQLRATNWRNGDKTRLRYVLLNWPACISSRAASARR